MRREKWHDVQLLESLNPASLVGCELARVLQLPGAMERPQHIAVAYDGSVQSQLGFYRALELASGSVVSKVHVVCAVESRGDRVQALGGHLLPLWAAARSVEQSIDCLFRQATCNASLPRVFVHVRVGEAAEAIVDVAYRQHAELIIMGAGLRAPGAAIGSVASRVLELSEIPVELQTGDWSRDKQAQFDALRFAYAFHGSELAGNVLGLGKRRGNALA